MKGRAYTIIGTIYVFSSYSEFVSGNPIPSFSLKIGWAAVNEVGATRLGDTGTNTFYAVVDGHHTLFDIYWISDRDVIQLESKNK